MSKKKTKFRENNSIQTIEHRRVFLLTTLLIPVLILVLLEALLRYQHYGGEYDLVLTTTIKGKEYYYINPTVGKRYFDPERYALPKVEVGYFEKQKPARTLRIVCLGASTTAGFPYAYNATPANMLRKQLQIAFPEKNIEVINAGLTATNSYTVVEFAREFVRYQPDVYIIYSGQNEFYGALGVGSTISFGQSRWFIKTYLWLRELRVFVLIEDVVTKLFHTIAGKGEMVPSGTLMQQMAQEKAIPYQSSLYRSAAETYRENLKEVVDIAASGNIPVVLSTLVTNERGLAPFVSLHRVGLTDNNLHDFDLFLKQGEHFLQRSDFAAAQMEFKKAVAIDSAYALTYFKLAQCCNALSNVNGAKVAYGKARDLDGLRFRASSEFNSIIRSMERSGRVVLADTDSTFRSHSPDGILGNELLWEHVHPNLKGYLLLSRTWYDALAQLSLFDPSDQRRLRAPVSDSLLASSLKISPLDEECGTLLMKQLLNRWPFKGDARTAQTAPASDLQRVASLYVHGTLRWNEAHYEMADAYLRQKKTLDAVREYETVNGFYPDDPFPLQRMGELYAVLGQNEKARDAFLRSLQLSENQFTLVKLGVLNVRMKRPLEAANNLSRAFEIDATAKTHLSRPQYEEAVYHYALSLSQLSRLEEAKQMLTLLLRQEPGHRNALNLMQEINRHTINGKK